MREQICSSLLLFLSNIRGSLFVAVADCVFHVVCLTLCVVCLFVVSSSACWDVQQFAKSRSASGCPSFLCFQKPQNCCLEWKERRVEMRKCRWEKIGKHDRPNRKNNGRRGQRKPSIDILLLASDQMYCMDHFACHSLQTRHILLGRKGKKLDNMGLHSEYLPRIIICDRGAKRKLK